MTVASPIRHPLWAALRAREEPASVPELAAAIGATNAAIAWRLSRWTQAGLLTAIKPPANEVRGACPSNDQQRTRYFMPTDARVHLAPPSLDQARRVSPKRSGRAAMWRAIRVLKRFDLVQLCMTAEVTESSAKVYVSALLRAGLLVREVRGKAATGQRSLYALVGRSGPQPPVVSQRREQGRTIAIVTDPNTGKAHEISNARPLPPLF